VGALGGSAAAPMADTICIIGGLINGFGQLNGLPKQSGEIARAK
jgi:hypothetical protein